MVRWICSTPREGSEHGPSSDPITDHWSLSWFYLHFLVKVRPWARLNLNLAWTGLVGPRPIGSFMVSRGGHMWPTPWLFIWEERKASHTELCAQETPGRPPLLLLFSMRERGRGSWHLCNKWRICLLVNLVFHTQICVFFVEFIITTSALWEQGKTRIRWPSFEIGALSWMKLYILYVYIHLNMIAHYCVWYI